MNNNEILETLLNREEDISQDADVRKDFNGRSVNGYAVDNFLKEWDTAEPFPIKEIKRYLRLNEWTAKDFNPRTELVIAKLLPRWFYKVYLAVKEFKASSRNELLSSQDAFARMMGYPISTASDKAFCVYEYALQTYYEGE